MIDQRFETSSVAVLFACQIDQNSGVEITAALPADLSERVFAVARQWRERGNSIIFISHRMAEVAALCDRADGWGLDQLKKKLSAPILVLSAERNPIVRARCEKLRLECINDGWRRPAAQPFSNLVRSARSGPMARTGGPRGTASRGTRTGRHLMLPAQA